MVRETMQKRSAIDHVTDGDGVRIEYKQIDSDDSDAVDGTVRQTSPARDGGRTHASIVVEAPDESTYYRVMFGGGVHRRNDDRQWIPVGYCATVEQQTDELVSDGGVAGMGVVRDALRDAGYDDLKTLFSEVDTPDDQPERIRTTVSPPFVARNGLLAGVGSLRSGDDYPTNEPGDGAEHVVFHALPGDSVFDLRRRFLKALTHN